MANYSIASLDAAKKLRSPFSALEGYVTFYLMSDYTPGKLRSAMTPIGKYLFINGFNLEDGRNFHPRLQPFGAKSKTLTAIESVESKLSLTCLFVQTGADTAWFAPGHPTLLAFVDLIADAGFTSKLNKDDVFDALGTIHQSIVIKDLDCTGSNINAQDEAMAGWNLSFVGGEFVYLAPTTMDLP